MVLEGAAILFVVAIFAMDARVQSWLLGSSKPNNNVQQASFSMNLESGLVKNIQINATPLSRVDNEENQHDELVLEAPATESDFAEHHEDQFHEDANSNDFVEVSSGSSHEPLDASLEPVQDDEYDSLSLETPEFDTETVSDNNGDELEYAQLDDFPVSNDNGSELSFDERSLSSSANPQESNSDIAQLELPQIPAENPIWWMLDFDRTLLENHIPLRATLDEVVFVALRNSPQLTILNTRPAIQETFVGEESAEFDWATFAETRWNELDEPIGSNLTTGVPGRFVQRQWTYEAGLKKRLFNGGEVKFGQQHGTLDNNSTFLDPPDQGSSQFTIDYRQPLLRGAGKPFNTSQVLLADLDFDATSSRAVEETQRFIVDVVSAYWDVYLARVRLIQTRRSVGRADGLLRQLKLRFGIDVSNDQLLRAEAAVAVRKSDVIRAEYELINAQDILNNLAMGPEATNATHIELIPDSLNLPSMIRLSEEHLVEVAIHNRPEIREAIAKTKSAEVRQLVASNSMLPKLDAIVQTYVQGLRGNKDFSGAFSDQFTGGNPSYSVGLTYDLPIGNRAAKARVQRSELESKLIQSEFRKIIGDVSLDVRIAARGVLRLNKEIENNFFALQKAGQELSLIGQRQKLGLDDNRTGSLYIEDLIASQARLSAAEQRLVEAQRQQAVSLIDLKRATGEFLQINGVAEVHSNTIAVPIGPALYVPPVVHQLSDKGEPNEVDFVPAVRGVKTTIGDGNGPKDVAKDASMNAVR